MEKELLIKKVRSRYHRTSRDYWEMALHMFREFWEGVDCSIFNKTLAYYEEIKNRKISPRKALSIALNKKSHKEAWFNKERKTVEDIMEFYKEVDIYPFRQPYLKRRGGYRWMLNLINHFQKPSVLEYGCGSAVLTEYFINKIHRTDVEYSVADIPSATLDFVNWKKSKYKYPYEILTIREGKKGIPLKKNYDLIICMDVLEHTPNPLEIVQSFSEHLSSGGVLLLDFIDYAEGENLDISIAQRDAVKNFLEENLWPVKKIDDSKSNEGVYVKPC